MGPTPAYQTAPSEHVGPPGLPHRLLLGTSSRQISSAYLGGILVWWLSYTLLLLGGSLGSHYVYCAIICKCERLGIHCDFHPILSPNSDSCDSILSQISALLCVVRLAVFVQCTGGNEKPLPTGNRTVG